MSIRHWWILGALALGLAAGCGVPDPRLSAPEWNAAGDRVAFIRYTESGATALYLLEPDGKDEPLLLAAGVERFAFAAHRLYFLRAAGAGDAAGAADAPKPGLYGVDLLRREPGEPQLVLEPEAGASFETLRASPAGLLYIGRREADAGKAAIVEFDPANETQKTVTPAELAAGWPAVSPRGTELAFLAPAKGGGVTVYRKALPAGDPVVMARLEKARPDSAAVAWGPAGDKLLAWYTEEGEEAAPRLALLEPAKGEKLRRALDLPRAGAMVLAAAFSPDGGKVCLTVLTRDRDENLGAESFELDLASGKARLLDSARGKAVGLRAYSRNGKRWVEFTPSGLALWEAGGKAAANLWPLDSDERLAVARKALAAGQAERAMKLVQAGLDHGGPEDDRGALLVLKSEILAADNGKPNEVSAAFLEGILRFPVSAEAPAAAEVVKRLELLAEAQPESRLLVALAEAWKLRADGKPLEAAKSFTAAATLSADRGWSAGLRFRAGESWLAAGRGIKAGEMFRKASDVEDFPQADWAGGLAVLAYAVGGHEQLAVENAQRCRDLFGKGKGVLAGDFAALGKALAGGACRARVVEQAKSPEGAAAARVEAWPVLAAHCSFRPTRTPAGAPARIALLRQDRWRLVVKPEKGPEFAALDGLAVPVARLSFSADGQMVAFLAGAEGRRSLYAVDLAGEALLGDLKKLRAGEPDPVTAAADYRWPDNAGLPEPVRNEPRKQEP